MKPEDWVTWKADAERIWVGRIIALKDGDTRALLEVDGTAGFRIWLPVERLRKLPEMAESV